MDGLDGKYVLVLMDCRPIYGRVDSKLDLSRVNINRGTIERIEVLRGPMSALYGSEALGGVISIISKPVKESFEAEVGLDRLTDAPSASGRRLTISRSTPRSTSCC